MTRFRKTVKIEIYEEDLPIIAAFMEHSDIKTDAEAFRYGIKLLGAMADDVKRLRISAAKGESRRLDYIG